MKKRIPMNTLPWVAFFSSTVGWLCFDVFPISSLYSIDTRAAHGLWNRKNFAVFSCPYNDE